MFQPVGAPQKGAQALELDISLQFNRQSRGNDVDRDVLHQQAAKHGYQNAMKVLQTGSSMSTRSSWTAVRRLRRRARNGQHGPSSVLSTQSLQGRPAQEMLRAVLAAGH
eukprot:3457415-Amphidinium_carterae.1